MVSFLIFDDSTSKIHSIRRMRKTTHHCYLSIIFVIVVKRLFCKRVIYRKNSIFSRSSPSSRFLQQLSLAPLGFTGR